MVFRISSRTLGSVEVEGSNWLVALGEGLGRLGVVDGLDRIACEVLRNGTILVRDVRRGAGYVVQPLDDVELDVPDETEETEHLAEEAEEDGPLPEGLVGWIDAILHATDVHHALKAALDAARATVPAEGGAVLLDNGGGSLRFAVVAGPSSASLRDVVLPAGTGVAGFSVDHAVALTVNEPYQDERFYAAVDERTGGRTRSILCVPVAVEHKVYGCIELINSPDAYGFPREALGDASLIADALAERLAAPPS